MRKPPPRPKREPAAVTKWKGDRLAAVNKRALAALESGLQQMKLFHSWRQIEFNAPPGSRLDLKARDMAHQHAQRAQGFFNVVRVALGYDTDADEPQPKRHWDAGA